MDFTSDELAMIKAGLAAQMIALRKQGEDEGDPYKYDQQHTDYRVLADKVERFQLALIA